MSQILLRTLACLSRDDDSLVWETPLTGIDLATPQRVFGLGDDGPMYEEFVVGPEQAVFLQSYVPKDIDINMYEYHVGCCAAEQARPGSNS